MPRAPDKDAKISCPTPQALQAEFDTLQAALDLGEGEHTWEKVDKGIVRFTAVVKGGGYKHANFVEGVGKHHAGLQLVGYMLSDKGKLSGTTIDLLTSFAPRLNIHFAPLVPLYLDPLIKLLGRPNKVFIRRAEHCLGEIISHCHIVSIIYELKKGLESDAPTGRRGCAAAMVKAVQQWPLEVWGEKGVRWLEDGIRRMGGDKDAEVRATGKVVWGLFAEQWHERVDDFAAPLSPTIKRRLDIKSDATVGGKGKTAVKSSMAPPAVPHRTAPAATSSSSSSSSSSAAASASASSSAHPHGPLGAPQAPVRNGHARVKSTTQARPIDVPPARRAAPASSAPTSPTKDKEHQPILSRSHTSRPETIGLNLGQPSRPVMHHHASSSGHRSPDKELWSKPQRPQFTTSQSTSAVEDVLSGPVRRFPPPSRGFRPPPAEDDLFNPSLAGPSVLRGPIRLPAPERAPPRLGPARRVVTAPYPSSQNPLTGPQRPTHPPTSASHSDLAAVLKGARSVKKRVEALEEEIRVNSPAGSPLPPRPSSAMGLSTPPGSLILGQRRIPMDTLSGGKGKAVAKVGEGAPAVDSPLLPVLSRSVDGRREVQREVDRNDDIRRISSGQDLADLTVMDVTVIPSRSDLEPAKGHEREEDRATGQARPGTQDRTEAREDLDEDERGDHAMTSIVVDLGSDAEDHHQQMVDQAESMGANHTGVPVISNLDTQVDAVPRAEVLGIEREDANVDRDDEHEGAEDQDETREDQKTAHVKGINEHDASDVDHHESGAASDDDEHHKTAKQVPLPSSPAKSTITLPEDEPEPIASAPVCPPPAPYPKEAPPRPRVVSRTGANLTADTAATAARKAAVPRKPALPPIVRRPANERKPFKPTSGASKVASKPPVPPAPVARARVVPDKDTTQVETVTTARSAAPTATAKPAIPPNVFRPHATRPATTKPSVNAKMNPPPIGVTGKGSTAPAVMARSVSAASSTSASTNSRPTKETLKPAVPKARVESKMGPKSTAPAPAAGAVTKPPVRATRPITSAGPATTAARTVSATSSTTAGDAGAAKIRRKAPLPSFKPVKTKDKLATGAGAATTGRQGTKPNLRVATTAANRPRAQPESVPLPLSPGERANMAPKDIPLPRSPRSKNAELHDEVDGEGSVEHEHEQGHEVEEMDEHEDEENYHGEQVDDENEAQHERVSSESGHRGNDVADGERPGAESITSEEGGPSLSSTHRPVEASNSVRETATAISIPVDTLRSPTNTMRASSLRSSPSAPSPLAVSQPRTVSPVLTIALQDSPPATPASASHRRFSSSASRALSLATSMDRPTYPSESFESPVAESRSKLVDAPSPEDIPSPFLSAARRTSRSQHDCDAHSASSRFTSKRTEMVADANDGEEEFEADDEVLDGVSTQLGQPGTGLKSGRSATRRQDPSGSAGAAFDVTGGSGEQTASGAKDGMSDLMEFSANSRPAHGERRDVSTPVKGTTEVLLAKLAGKVGTPVERVPLALRDANTGAAIGVGAADGTSEEDN